MVLNTLFVLENGRRCNHPESIKVNEKMTKTYEINKLTDFTKVPARKLEKCLDEFYVWVNIMRKAKKFPEIVTPVEKFLWTDDNEHRITIKISARDSKNDKGD